MGRNMSGTGITNAPLERDAVRDALLDPARLARAIPGARSVERLADGRFAARLGFGVGPIRSVYDVELAVSTPADPYEFDVAGSSRGGLGRGRASGRVRLLVLPGGRTAVHWRYEGDIGGPVALAGETLLTAAGRVFCTAFFDRLIRDLTRRPPSGGRDGPA